MELFAVWSNNDKRGYLNAGIVREEISDLVATYMFFELPKFFYSLKEVYYYKFEGMEKFRLKKGLILTGNSEDRIEIKGMEVFMTPLWKWLLSEEI